MNLRRPVGLVGLLALVACNGGGNGSAEEHAAGKTAQAASVASTAAANAAPAATIASSTSSTPVCTSDVIQCATDIQNPSNRDRCLSMYAACGKYVDIIEFYRAQTATDRQEAYFLGVAYHGLFILNRSPAAKCQFGSAARNQLEEYLKEVTTGENGTSPSTIQLNDLRTFQQTYHAANLLESVKTIAGCQSGGATYNEVFNYAYNRGTTIADGLFVGSPPADVAPTVNTVRSSFQQTVRSFVSIAADVELQLGTRQAAYDQSDIRINNVWNTLTARDGFGATGTRSDVKGKDAGGHDVLKPWVTGVSPPDPRAAFGVEMARYLGSAGNKGLQAQANDALEVVKAQMGNMDPAAYETTRDNVVVPYARTDVAWAATLTKRASDADPSANNALLRNTLQSNVGGLRGGDDGSSYFNTIKAKLKAGAAPGVCPTPATSSSPWYCK